MEDEDSPLDLLDRKALGNISSSKPARRQQPSKQKGKVNIDGKLVIGTGDSDDDDPMAMDFDADGKSNGKEISLEGGINAYVDAIKGRDAVQRGRGGRLKFSNKREKPANGDVMEVAEDAAKSQKPAKVVRFSEGRDGRGGRLRGGRASGSGRGGMNGKRTDPKSQRRGLGMAKVSGGRVMKGSGEKGRKVGRGGR